jgi:tRNA pseudouridine38-40 synthase
VEASRFKIFLSYDGSAYSGWQIQPNSNTIQGEVEKALRIILRGNIKVVGSGRTDAGVHALLQVAHFDSRDIDDIQKLVRSTNGILKKDIRVLKIEKTDMNFHARKSVKRKKYVYMIYNNSCFPPVLQGKVLFFPRRLELKLMKEAADILIGRHDFSSFKASDCSSKTQVREIFNISIEEVFHFYHPVLEISITGSGFLKHMVRNIVGTLLKVGTGGVGIDKFIEIFNSRDRINAGPTSPALGLYLKEIEY